MRKINENVVISKINSINNISFLRWCESYAGTRTKATVRCLIDGFEWTTKASNLIYAGQGCPECGGNRIWSETERIDQINSIKNIEFVEWSSGYRSACSKAIVRCLVDGFQWSASVRSLHNNRSGCPRCHRCGFDKGKDGHLYALLSSCGNYIKIGISNNIKTRMYQLSKYTPFEFNRIGIVSGSGDYVSSLERYFHEKYERAGFRGFDGCTEWLLSTAELLDELRNARDFQIQDV